MSDSRDERKRKFLEAQKERQSKKNRNGGGGNSPQIKIPDYKYLYLKPNACQVFRMVGNPLEVRSLPTDPIMVERSVIVDDNGEYFTLIWSPDKDHPLNILRRKLCKFSYKEKDGSKKKEKVYDNEGCELLNRFLTNGKDNPNSMEQGWNPTRYVLANVIDRMDNWCKENNSTKVVSWKETPSKKGDGKFYYDPGMKISFYAEIFDVKCTEHSASFEDFDIVCRRFTEKTRPNTDTNFKIYHYEEKSAISKWGEADGVDYYSKIKQVDNLDDEDASFNRFPLENIPFVSLPTPMYVILAKVGSFIKSFDKKYGTNLYEKCVEMKGDELNNNAGKTEENSAKEHVDVDLPSGVEEKPEIKLTKKAVAKKTFTKDDLTEEMLELFPGLEDMSDEDLSLITNVDMDNQEIVWAVPLDSSCGNDACGEALPDAITKCPYCATKFQ